MYLAWVEETLYEFAYWIVVGLLLGTASVQAQPATVSGSVELPAGINDKKCSFRGSQYPISIWRAPISSFTNSGGLTSVNALVGTMATPFGTLASRSFATANTLIYHYFSAVRGASVLRDNADQLSRRDAPNYSGRGQPTLYDACWNTGLQLFGSFGPVTYALAMT